MSPRPNALGATLTIAGVALLVWWEVTEPGLAPWAAVLDLIALAGWLGRTVAALCGLARIATIGAAIAIAAGAVAAPATAGNAVVPAAVCVMLIVADESLPLLAGIVAALGAAALVGVGAIAHPVPLVALLGMLAGLAVGALAGYSRRQTRRGQRQAGLLAERDVAMREEASRVAIARDLHDVLAHTLGGLVIQLDATEALLEAGDQPAALRRVTGARELAGAGLVEARRAVAALRAPRDEDAADVHPAAFDTVLEDLAAAHRALGGAVQLTCSGAPAVLAAAQATALERALQEALSNARRHAPGAPVIAEVSWQDDRVTLSVANSTPVDRVSTAPGYGLIGMRERVAALPRGGSVAVVTDAGVFTVTAQVWLG